MGISINNQNSRYYDYFRDQEIVFTKVNIQILRIDPRQVYIKCNGGQWPCIINSSSLQMAKIIIGTSNGALEEFKKNPKVPFNLRYCFLDQNNAPISFFVNCNIINVQKYEGANDLALVTLNFSQRPPDDLISRLGEFIETNENFKNRKEDRIEINQNSIRRLGIEKEETIIYVEQVPRNCILKDLSFGGAKILVGGVPKFIIGKSIVLKINFIDTGESVSLEGSIPKAEFLEGRKDIAIVHISFNSEKVPMSYKRHINNYIANYQKGVLNNQIGPFSNLY